MGVDYNPGGGSGPVNASIPFLAGNFSAQGAMTWTVDPADVKTFEFSLNGKMLTLTFRLVNTTVGGVVAGNNLLINLPNGMLAASESVQDCSAAPGGGASEGILSFIGVGGGQLVLLRYSANWIAGANNTDVNGVVTIRVQ